MAIPDEEVAQVRAATDLVGLISEHLGLRQQGRRWVGLCPFHQEKTPSFSVNAEAGFYYCFGCQASGDAITFVRETEHLDFVDAVRLLADRAGVMLHETEDSGPDRQRRTRLLEAMARAVQWYHERLLSAPDAGRARDYLRSRGYDGEVVRRFVLGWAPDEWDGLCSALGLTQRVAVDTGLGFVNRTGRLQDAFRARVLFPIFDPSGRPVALGGRVLPGGSGAAGTGSAGSPGPSGERHEPKYKNSQETAIYSKRRTLYALNWAKHDIVATGEVVVCEGYTDVIGFFGSGVPRAVATCGTALAEDHLRLLHNYGRRIVLAYDADQAGQAAAARLYEWERRHDVDLRVAALPGGSDPADLARSDPQALRDAVRSAVPYLQFRVDRLLAGSDLSTPEGRAKAAEAALAAVAEHPDALVRDQYVMRVADMTRLDPASLRAWATTAGRSSGGSLQSRRGKGGDGVSRQSAAAHAADEPSQSQAAETGPGSPRVGTGQSRRASSNGHRASRPGLEALKLALHCPDLVADRLEEVLFDDPLQRRAFTALAASASVGEAVDRADPEVADLLRRLIVEEPVIPDDQSTDPAAPVIAQLVREAARRALGELQAEGRTGRRDLAEVAKETATVRRWIEDLDDAELCGVATSLLVAWLLGGMHPGSVPSGPLTTTEPV